MSKIASVGSSDQLSRALIALQGAANLSGPRPTSSSGVLAPQAAIHAADLFRRSASRVLEESALSEDQATQLESAVLVITDLVKVIRAAGLV